ncbi:MAG: TraB/GumN family protein [Flavobacteriaceae bacterium]|nr:TraB/GumN family protein [Flavobacteriaceae bacterium]|tara:strand:- start:2222 stop:3085 length:864 start_codon:yes stop_codon:yes gene_type:complete
MKRILSLLVITTLSIFSITAQELENSTLWKIEGNGLESPSYLFGTIHMTCDATLEDDVKKALDETTQIVMELDMDDPSMQSKVMQGMYLKDGKTLKDFVSDEEYKSIDSLFINNMGMSVKLLENVKPFFLMSMFYPKMIDCQMQSFELELTKIASEQKEEIYGLETIEEQIKVFDGIPLEDQYADLIRMAKDNLAFDKTTFSKMLKIYKEEDINALIDIMDDDTNSTMSKHQDVLLEQRNKNWISKIGEYAKEQPTFFGVGAGHLPGENGVIQLLRNAGYTVTAVLE